jgi:nuclear transport factor 2 (NTF2) superfamily protein
LRNAYKDVGVAVERQVELFGFKRTETGIAATLRHADGQEEAAPTNWLLRNRPDDHPGLSDLGL